MLFNSYEFILLFLPVVCGLYFLLNRVNLSTAAQVFLVLSSLFFYGYWKPIYLPIILGSIGVNYLLGYLLNQKPAKWLLTLGVIANILLLGYFKYADFFIGNYNLLTQGGIEPLNLLLPLAISFFTFQQIAYLVDTYRGHTKDYNFLDYSLFVTFFPQLIAGPIVHHKEMMPQFADKLSKSINYDNLAKGIFIFSIGLFKKVVLADQFAQWATAGFDHAEQLDAVEGWITSLSYTLQLYFDFSGYTDMAIGAALLFNIKLPINFNSPYKAYNIQDFWRRWHITLSRFLRDYIYIPLGGNRGHEALVCTNLLITFLIGGLWHGVGWLFLLWGALHGVALIIHRLWAKLATKLQISMPRWLAWLITFNFINLTWIFFRATSWESANKVINAMFSGQVTLSAKNLRRNPWMETLTDYGVSFGKWMGNIDGEMSEVWVIVGLLICLLAKNTHEIGDKFKSNWIYLVICLGILFYALSMMGGSASEFLYFNF